MEGGKRVEVGEEERGKRKRQRAKEREKEREAKTCLPLQRNSGKQKARSSFKREFSKHCKFMNLKTLLV